MRSNRPTVTIVESRDKNRIVAETFLIGMICRFKKRTIVNTIQEEGQRCERQSMIMVRGHRHDVICGVPEGIGPWPSTFRFFDGPPETGLSTQQGRGSGDHQNERQRRQAKKSKGMSHKPMTRRELNCSPSATRRLDWSE